MEMRDQIPREELPFGISKAIEVKHEQELNDMLAKLFEQKCKELQEEIFHLIEEKMHMQGLIIKESKDSLELVIEMEDKAVGDTEHEKAIREKAAKIREAVK